MILRKRLWDPCTEPRLWAWLIRCVYMVSAGDPIILLEHMYFLKYLVFLRGLVDADAI